MSAYFRLYNEKRFLKPFITGKVGIHRVGKGVNQEAKKRQIHLHIFRLNGPSESARGDGS